MKKTITLISACFMSFYATSQVELIGARMDFVVNVYFDNYTEHVFHNDTLVMFDSDSSCTNFISKNGYVTKIIRVLPIGEEYLMKDSLTKMVEIEGLYYFELNEEIFRCDIFKLNDKKYFAVSVEKAKFKLED